MRILIVGATGTIGHAIVSALKDRHDLLLASRVRAPYKVDITDVDSIRALYQRVGRVDAVVSAAGGGAWKLLPQLTEDDFEKSLHDKLMGQVNLIRYGMDHVNDRGSITVTSGILARQPQQGSAAVSLINAGLEGFTRAAALEAPRGIRINVVSPPWVSETLRAMGQDPDQGLPADVVAEAYVESVEGDATGQVMEPTG